MVSATIGMFFEVTNRNGEAWCEYTKTDLELEGSLDLRKYADERIAFYAEVHEIPKENIRVISRKEYEENMGE